VHLITALKIYPGNLPARYHLARLYVLLGKKESALPLLEGDKGSRVILCLRWVKGARRIRISKALNLTLYF